MVSFNKFGAVLAFQDRRPGGSITHLDDRGLAKHMGLHEGDLVLEVHTRGEDVRLQHERDDDRLDNLPLECTHTVEVLFRSAKDHKLHWMTAQVADFRTRMASYGDVLGYSADVDDVIDITLEE